MRHAQNSHKKDVDNGLLNLLPTIMNYGEVSPEIDTSRTGNLGVKFSARLNGEFAVAVWVEFFPFQEVHADDLTLKSIHIKKERLYK